MNYKYYFTEGSLMKTLYKYLSALLCLMFIPFMTVGCVNNANSPEIPEENIEITTAQTEENVNETPELSEETKEENVATEPLEPILPGINSEVLGKLECFEVTSGNLNNNVWDDIISNTDVGSNHSPELTWEAVDGAESYVIDMVDTTAANWIHWKSSGITETTLPEGFAESSEYIGPYPPAGAPHTYEIYILALKETPERAKGAFNGQNPKFVENLESLDINQNGESGNIISYGFVAGTFTSK